MNVAVIQFPGSNCDADALHAAQTQLDPASRFVWHTEEGLPSGTDLVFLPGGFSYGDHLRSGAIAARSPIMQAVKQHAERGGFVLGVCNGFQVLTESGLLPGALSRNQDLHFLCKPVHLRVETNQTAFTSAYSQNQSIEIPIAHGEGNYYADADTLARLEGEGTGGVPLPRQSERQPQRHRRNRVGARQRAGHDAAPGAGHRSAAGQRGRARSVRQPEGCAGQMTALQEFLAEQYAAELSAFRASLDSLGDADFSAETLGHSPAWHALHVAEWLRLTVLQDRTPNYHHLGWEDKPWVGPLGTEAAPVSENAGKAAVLAQLDSVSAQVAGAPARADAR